MRNPYDKDRMPMGGTFRDYKQELFKLDDGKPWNEEKARKYNELIVKYYGPSLAMSKDPKVKRRLSRLWRQENPRRKTTMKKRKRHNPESRYDLKYLSGGHGGPFHGLRKAIKAARQRLKGIRRSRPYEAIIVRRYTSEGFTPEYWVRSERAGKFGESRGEGIEVKRFQPHERKMYEVNAGKRGKKLTGAQRLRQYWAIRRKLDLRGPLTARSRNPASWYRDPHPRFVSQEQMAQLVNLYHLARVPLSGKKAGKYERMLWASAAFHKKHPGISQTAAYKDLDAQLAGWNPRRNRKRR